MTAVVEQVVDGVVATIKALNLSGVTSTNVVGMTSPDDEQGSGPNVGGFPAIIVWCPGGETAGEGTNIRDDWTYPVSVLMVSNENKNQTTNRTRNTTWRQSIRKAFHNKRLSGVTGGDVLPSRVVLGVMADRPRWLQGQQAQAMRIDVPVREART